MSVTEWWLVRHAPTVNPGGIVYGAMDLDIEAPPRERFAALSDMLPREPAWMVSNLSRTRRTLDGILRARGAADAEIIEEPAFAEQDFGSWEGRPRAEVWAEISGAGLNWPGDARPPGGESFSEVAARVAEAADRWSGRLRGRPVVAVIHAGSIRGFLAAAMGGAAGEALRFAVDTLSVTSCDRGEVWRVAFVNRPAPPR